MKGRHTSGVRSCPFPPSVLRPDEASCTMGCLSSPRRTTPIEIPGIEPFFLISSTNERKDADKRVSVWRSLVVGDANGCCVAKAMPHVAAATKMYQLGSRAMADVKAEECPAPTAAHWCGGLGIGCSAPPIDIRLHLAGRCICFHSGSLAEYRRRITEVNPLDVTYRCQVEQGEEDGREEMSRRLQISGRPESRWPRSKRFADLSDNPCPPHHHHLPLRRDAPLRTCTMPNRMTTAHSQSFTQQRQGQPRMSRTGSRGSVAVCTSAHRSTAWTPTLRYVPLLLQQFPVLLTK